MPRSPPPCGGTLSRLRPGRTRGAVDGGRLVLPILVLEHDEGHPCERHFASGQAVAFGEQVGGHRRAAVAEHALRLPELEQDEQGSKCLVWIHRRYSSKR